MKIDLGGQNILVTGASRGIGAAIATQLMEAGARVALHCRKEVDKAQEIALQGGSDSKVFVADLADPQACGRLWEEVEEQFGGIHALVNNAGVAIHSPDTESEEEWLLNWEKTLRVNLTASALLSRRAVRHFQVRGGGRIVFIGSRAAFRGDTPDYLAYGASKGGMASLARSLARGYGKQNIQSFLINPGFVQTDMAQDFLDAYGEDYALNDIALPSLTQSSDVAPLVAFLCSGMADHATGSCIDVNAGSYVR